MKRKILFATLITCSGLFFSACQDEEFEKNKITQESSIVHIDQAFNQSISALRSIPTQQSLSKGYYMDLSFIDEPIEYSECVYIPDNTIRYKTMKVKRRNSDKYFYIMVENVGVRLDSACSAYNNLESLVPKYGRLYTWNAANALAPHFKMTLPVYNANGDSITSSVARGHLITAEDMYDLLEIDSIGMNPDLGYSVDDCNNNWGRFYADAFIFGIESADADPTKGYASLAGCYSEHISPIHFWDLNLLGGFWTDMHYDSFTSSHQPLQLRLVDNWNYVYYCLYGHNVAVYNSDRLSVRYVFEPRYLNR